MSGIPALRKLRVVVASYMRLDLKKQRAWVDISVVKVLPQGSSTHTAQPGTACACGPSAGEMETGIPDLTDQPVQPDQVPETLISAPTIK